MVWFQHSLNLVSLEAKVRKIDQNHWVLVIRHVVSTHPLSTKRLNPSAVDTLNARCWGNWCSVFFESHMSTTPFTNQAVSRPMSLSCRIGASNMLVCNWRGAPISLTRILGCGFCCLFVALHALAQPPPGPSSHHFMPSHTVAQDLSPRLLASFCKLGTVGCFFRE